MKLPFLKSDEQWWAEYREAHQWDELAQYNAERQRGIMHTPEWDERMAYEQRKFEEAHPNYYRIVIKDSRA